MYKKTGYKFSIQTELLSGKYFLVLLIFFAAINVNAQWVQTNGPEGGWCQYMYSHNGYLFVTAHGSVIYRSSDNGNNWNLLHTFPFFISNSALTSQGIYLFLATSSNGVMRSSDNGLSWSAVNTGFPFSSYTVERIVTSGQYLISGRYRLFRSSNYGNSWDSCTNGMATPLTVYELTVIGSNVYAGTTKGAYVTTNNGNNWTSINNGIATQTVNKISSDGTFLYAGTSIGIYKSTNQGAQWFPVNNGLPTDWYYDILFDGTYLFATTLSGRYRSSNGGENWETCNNGLTSLASIRFYISGERLFSVLWGGAGIQYTTNHGSNWIVSNKGFYGFYSNSIAVKDNIIYTCGYMQGLATSTNDGESWQYISNSMIDRYVRSVAANNSCVFVSTYNKGLLKTTNNGIDWIPCNNGTDSTENTKVLYAYDDVLFASDYDNSYSYRSTNNGANWTGFASPIIIQTMARIGDVFLAGNSSMEGGGMISSTDKGFSWSFLNQNFLPRSIVAKDSVFYLFSWNGYYKSTNLGLNWVPFTSDLTEANKIYLIGNKFVCISDTSVYTSSNNGVNWISKSQGLPYFEDLGTIISKGANVFLTTTHRGVWKISLSDLLPVVNTSSEIPSEFSLSQNYPNPFNPTTKVRFAISLCHSCGGRNPHVIIKVFDIMGKEVQTLVNERLQPGTYETSFDGSKLTSGVYFYKLITGTFTETKKMLLIR